MSEELDREERLPEFGSPGGESSSKKWRGFLAHLGPYVVVIGMLAFINMVTDPGGYPWFIWPAMGWGVGLAFHLFGIILGEMKSLSGKWHSFLGHFGSYAIIMGLLIGIYLMSDPGGYPWFIWPAMGWGVAVALHLWSALLGGNGQPRRQGERQRRRAERHAAKKERRAQQQPEQQQTQSGLEDVTIQTHLDKARTYQQQVDDLIRTTKSSNARQRLQDLAKQMNEWIQAIESLSRRIDNFQQNAVIQQDLASVPQSIAKLERQLATESDAVTRAELERTLNNRQNQLAALQHLQNTMKRAEIRIESTLSSLGTIYSQMLIGQSTDHVADYSHLSEEVDEEVRALQDHLEALEEVKLSSFR